ncbi:Ger(x)C family spore germination C-terminal domain-containing protein [Paenibacillus sp. ATY16]|uniref:Ger(x)C family spore germination C-terminal domain-containing protein n=1 Tax=Paenibacillus sp. ATY16 TaxID=1759312 RepID=UPI00200E5304|nr:Ger(x)C family spore germination C-terminal domain-containing protein [Paenibacillus sp. ATY16]MCK9858669.1 hypothetical protein [Paenibacillus sp. ATY16]
MLQFRFLHYALAAYECPRDQFESNIRRVTIHAARMKWRSSIASSGPELVGKLSLKVALTESKFDEPKSKHEADLKRLFNKELERITEKLQKSACDPIGMGNYFRGKIPFNQLADWRTEYYPNTKVKYIVDVSINNLGSLIQQD